MSTQAEKAQNFKSLHQAGNPLVLFNIWDAHPLPWLMVSLMAKSSRWKIP